MKSDSMNSLWVKTRKGLVLVEEVAAVQADNSVIDIAALASRAQSLAPGEVLDASSGEPVTARPALSGRPYPFS